MPDISMLWTGPLAAPRRYQVTIEAVADAVVGGEGLVYRAYDTSRDKDVALKLLTVVHVADYGRLVERSTLFTTITHPNLMSHVEVFIGTALTDDPTPDIDDFDVIYSVAEWIDGHPLPDVADAADSLQLLGYVAGIARGLHTLHRHRAPDAPHGIVHRDVKPSNVRITPDDTPVLIDFGVARPLDHGDLTQGVGTYRWRAPEVLSGSAPITIAVDTWGLGAIAYWTLTGQPPGLDGAAAAREQMIHTPRCQQLTEPVGAATHIATLLATGPAHRPKDLARWATQLETILASTGRSRSHIRSAVQRGAPAAIAVVALAGGALSEAAVGASVNDRLVAHDIPVDPRIVVFDPGLRANVGTLFSAVAFETAEAGAGAIGYVEFDSFAFGDGGNGRSSIVHSDQVQAHGAIPLLGVSVEYAGGDIPFLSSYRIDPLSSELAGVGVPIPNTATTVRTVPAIVRGSSLESGSVVRLSAEEVAANGVAANVVIMGLSLRLIELATGDKLGAVAAGGVTIGGAFVPLEDGFLRVNWSEAMDSTSDPQVVDFEDEVGDSHVLPDPSIFQDAIVLVGSTDPAQALFFDTPVGPMPEVLIHANAINTVLTRRFVRPVPWWVPGLALAGVALLVSLTPIGRWRFLIAAVAAGTWLYAVRFAGAHGRILPALFVPVALLVGAIIFAARRQFEDPRERKRFLRGERWSSPMDAAAEE